LDGRAPFVTYSRLARIYVQRTDVASLQVYAAGEIESFGLAELSLGVGEPVYAIHPAGPVLSSNGGDSNSKIAVGSQTVLYCLPAGSNSGAGASSLSPTRSEGRRVSARLIRAKIVQDGLSVHNRIRSLPVKPKFSGAGQV